MGRRQAIERNSNGSATLRLTLPPCLWTLIEGYAGQIGLNAEDATRIFLAQLEAMIIDGDAPWLAADWRRVLRGLDVNADELNGIDLTKLHRSDRTKSGFVGIYANGAGFRATGRRGEYIGTFKTAELAAYKRFQHYAKHGLPYGELELEIDRLRSQGEQGSDDELKERALETARHSGLLHLYGEVAPAGFTPGGLEEASAALRERDAAEEQPRKGRSLIKPRA